MANFHARSNSLPSRSHPLITQIDEHLCRLKSNETASSSSPSKKLCGLRDLYELVDSFLQLPATQASVAQQCNDKQVNESLNGSIKLLDVCGVAKDAFLQAKEDTQQLQSVLRRRGDGAGFTNEAKQYLASRKKAKKLINKSLKACKSGFARSENDVEVAATFGMLREVERVAFTVFESLFSYISGTTKMEPKSTKWSLVSNLMSSKRVTCEVEATETNEFEKVDAVLCSLIGHKTRKSGKMSNDDAQIELQKLESSIQDLEEGVECLMRLLIKTRVSILNILSH